MKQSIREKRAIVIYFTFYLLLTIGLLVFFFASILPGINEIEEKKENTNNVYLDIEKISKEGVNLGDFKKNIASSKDKNSITNEVLKNIDTKFFEENLVNTGAISYSKFIEEKRKELKSDKYIDTIKNQDLKLIKILPTYSDKGILLEENELTDYKFINYIESLLETFNLTTPDSLGINKIELLDKFAIKDNRGDNLSSNIYSIGLSLELKGTKASIIDFLYFADNVGRIDIKGDSIIVNTDYSYLNKNGTIKVLEGNKYQKGKYNIFENQIMDVDKILISDYIDSKYTSFRGNDEFKNFIVKTQGNNEFSVKVDLNFYIKGQPVYKIKEFINSTMVKYGDTQKFINTQLKNNKLSSSDRYEAMKGNDLLKSLSKDNASLKKGLNDLKNLDKTYESALRIDEILSEILKNNK